MSKRSFPDDFVHQAAGKRRPPPTNFPTLPDPLPDLPVLAPHLTNAPFIHKSAAKYSRSSSIKDISYERLEFVGDAYIELYASTLIFDRLPYLHTGQMSQLRESLVKNETLAEYSRAYGFDKRIEVDSLKQMEAGASKANKGLKKVFGDVFEAYVAAVVISDKEDGYATAENWCRSLWEPRIKAWEKANADTAHGPQTPPIGGQPRDPRHVFNPDAKQELARRLTWSGKEVRFKYEPWKPMVELKGDQIGQSQHFIAVYLTGYGFEKKLLGRGEGKSRGEAGQWAAVDAIHGDSKEFVAECAQKCIELKEKRKQQAESEEKVK